MSYVGKVHNGVVVLNEGAQLGEGTVVRVEPLPVESSAEFGGHARLLALAGALKGLPPDFASNHDHYIHGAPKQ